MSQQRRRGPMGGHGMQPTEKAKDFKDSMKSSLAIWADINFVLS